MLLLLLCLRNSCTLTHVLCGECGWPRDHRHSLLGIRSLSRRRLRQVFSWIVVGVLGRNRLALGRLLLLLLWLLLHHRRPCVHLHVGSIGHKGRWRTNSQMLLLLLLLLLDHRSMQVLQLGIHHSPRSRLKYLLHVRWLRLLLTGYSHALTLLRVSFRHLLLRGHRWSRVQWQSTHTARQFHTRMLLRMVLLLLLEVWLCRRWFIVASLQATGTVATGTGHRTLRHRIPGSLSVHIPDSSRSDWSNVPWVICGLFRTLPVTQVGVRETHSIERLLPFLISISVSVPRSIPRTSVRRSSTITGISSTHRSTRMIPILEFA